VSIKFPNVPLTAGVPAVFRKVELAVASVVLFVENKLVASRIKRAGKAAAAVWAIYDSGGNDAIKPDNWVTFEPLAEATVADYPMQPGAFQSYNKYNTPREVRITVTKGGPDFEREDFLLACDRLRSSTELLNILVPDYSFIGYTLTHVSYSRASDRGITLLQVDLSFREIRQEATAEFSNSKQPSGTDTVNNGPVRPVPISSDLVGLPE
jgi:hypothetical protein